MAKLLGTPAFCASPDCPLHTECRLQHNRRRIHVPRVLEVMPREWESLNAKAELARMHRDGHCLEAVMWYVHHLLESVKTATRWLGRVVVPPTL